MILILMGVVGSGKTTVGGLLAAKLGWQFADADDFHSPQNIEKIRHGIALGDADRTPWLAALRGAILQWTSTNQNAVLACSALKRKYRDELCADGVRFVYLKGSHDLILQRLQARRGHFASDSILESQLADLEPPNDAIAIEIDQTPEAIADEIIEKIKTLPAAYPDAANANEE